MSIPELFLLQLQNPQPVVISLSAQSRASLAVHFNATQELLLTKLYSFFKLLGVHELVLFQNY